MTHRFDLEPSEAGGERACAHCGRPTSRHELDDHLWCPDCRADLERTAARGRYLVALAVTLPFGAWIVIEGPRGVLPAYAWALPLAAAWFLGQRIGREVIRGWLRARRGA
jgi:hypothetical protein